MRKFKKLILKMFIFLGGGGAGLSALASIFFEVGIKDIVVVDKNKSQITDNLEKKGIKVIIGDGIYNFKKEDIIIYSDAVINCKDFEKIRENTKMTYFEFLGEISKWFQTIAIAGTHGKTSTTAMCLQVGKKIKFNKIGLGIVGGLVPDLENKNYFVNENNKEEIRNILQNVFEKKGRNKKDSTFKELYFILEADEFNKHFLLLDSCISLITSLDYDHKDVYKTQKEYDQAFEIFKLKTREKIFKQSEIKKYNINFEYVFGEYMKSNAILVIELYKYLGFDEKEIVNILKEFKGIWRRQEFLGNIEELKIYTDYAHHPTEIKATIEAFREKFKSEKIIGIFQAHQIMRLKSLEKEFIEILKKFDEIIMYDIYSAREEKSIKEISEGKISLQEYKIKIGKEMSEKINGTYIKSFETLVYFIKNKKGVGVILTAGDLDYKIRSFLKTQNTYK